MEMITGLPPTRLVNKFVLKRELDPYFAVDTLEQLIMVLRKLKRQGYLNFDVQIKSDYFAWQRSRTDLKLQADILNHPDPFGMMYRDEYGLGGLIGGDSTQDSLND